MQRKQCIWAQLLTAGLAITSAFTSGCNSSERPAAQSATDRAQQIATEMMNAIGGQDAWNRARYIRFDFLANITARNVKAERHHLWDKSSGRYRIESKDKAGRSLVTLFHVGTREGDVYVDGAKLSGSERGEGLKSAYGMFINDLYWLAMPWKWLDAGVNLKYAGKKDLRGNAYDVVELTFGNVGLTPGDRYEAYVSPGSRLMEHWKYVLQSGQTGEWDWQYTTTGGIKLASNHTDASGASINMGEVRVLDSVEDAWFSDPKKELVSLR